MNRDPMEYRRRKLDDLLERRADIADLVKEDSKHQRTLDEIDDELEYWYSIPKKRPDLSK